MKLRTLLLYFLVFFISVLVFMVVLFPAENIGKYIKASLKNKNSTAAVTFDRLKPEFPLKLNFQKLHVSYEKKIDLNFDTFTLRPDLKSIFSKNRQLVFQSGLYQGAAEGKIEVAGFDPLRLWLRQVSISGIVLDDIKYTVSGAEIVWKCRLKLDYDCRHFDEKKNQGKCEAGIGTVQGQDFFADLKIPFLKSAGLTGISFSEILINFEQKADMIRLTRFTASGNDMNVRMQGVVDFSRSIDNPSLKLEGSIMPDSTYFSKLTNIAVIKAAAGNRLKNGLKFKIAGTLKNPEIKL